MTPTKTESIMLTLRRWSYYLGTEGLIIGLLTIATLLVIGLGFYLANM